MITTEAAWLKMQKEPKQSFLKYASGEGGHKWISKEKKTIYLFCVDETISKVDASKYKLYAEAMFPGANF